MTWLERYVNINIRLDKKKFKGVGVMEKSCLNCKYYYNKTCNNCNLNIQTELNTTDAVHVYTEEGYLHEDVIEKIEMDDVTKPLYKKMIEENYIKKNMIDKLNKIDTYDIEVNLHEMIEDIIFKTVLPMTRKNSVQSKMIIKDPNNFYCSNWE